MVTPSHPRRTLWRLTAPAAPRSSRCAAAPAQRRHDLLLRRWRHEPHRTRVHLGLLQLQPGPAPVPPCALGTSQRLWPALAVGAAYRMFGTPLPPKWLTRRTHWDAGWRIERWPFEQASVTVYSRPVAPHGPVRAAGARLGRPCAPDAAAGGSTRPAGPASGAGRDARPRAQHRLGQQPAAIRAGHRVRRRTPGAGRPRAARGRCPFAGGQRRGLCRRPGPGGRAPGAAGAAGVAARIHAAVRPRLRAQRGHPGRDAEGGSRPAKAS